MSKYIVPIEVELPFGYTPTGEYREPLVGEWYMTASGGVKQPHDNDHCGRLMKRVIVRKEWEAPFWMRDGLWLYYNNYNGVWMLSRTEPEHLNCRTGYRDTHGMEVNKLCELFGYEAFATPPFIKQQIQQILPF